MVSLWNRQPKQKKNTWWSSGNPQTKGHKRIGNKGVKKKIPVAYGSFLSPILVHDDIMLTTTLELSYLVNIRAVLYLLQCAILSYNIQQIAMLKSSASNLYNQPLNDSYKPSSHS